MSTNEKMYADKTAAILAAATKHSEKAAHHVEFRIQQATGHMAYKDFTEFDCTCEAQYIYNEASDLIELYGLALDAEKETTTIFTVTDLYTSRKQSAELIRETKCYYTVQINDAFGEGRHDVLRFHKATMRNWQDKMLRVNEVSYVKPTTQQQAPTTNDREAWLIEAGDYLMSDIINPTLIELKQDLKRPPVKYSVSYAPNTRTGSATLGVCSSRSASTGGHNEIFISPELDGSRSDDVMGVLLHELIHAYLDNEDGHKGRFAKIATTIGFERPLTTFKPSIELKEILTSYIDLLGPIPHDKLDYGSIKKKQKSRHLLVRCSHETCDFQFRTSRKQVDLMQHSTCLICGDESLVLIDDNA